ncbi:MAG: glycine cleavage system protein GcvH [Methylococcaceae bacterium]|nr:glycine cleavage system protein GcvH [Methylococcaceae bacterium]MDZ4155583.1 glycine cleavage system protein GcvH [Methylococcales bacterium]MDP2395306.1 glycine cleavage system protein GcvH [Methylococcaceae bacterium]MDP3020582.1 glycine cleavage system protein GcvH [Methylococcaceae bacterium]MDP3390021.1 glycine cleavage system protein GcvH [Methylococcaceae bacterium]
MSNLPTNLRYAPTHEWVKVEENNLVHVGITDFAQQELGDLVFIELPQVGRQVDAQEQCAVVESVKTASDLFSPVAGEIVAVNKAVADVPEQVNEDPYGSWLFTVKADNLADLESLLDAADYQALIDQ